MHVDPAVNTKHPTADEAVMNANRIVACVNACEEINPEAVKDLLAAARLVAVSEDRPKFQNLLVDSDAVVACRAAIAKAEGK